MILPDYNSKGMLEDVCLDAIEKDNDPAIPCVEDFFECLNHKGLKSKNISKAKVQAFLASREKPGFSIGVAAKRDYWPINDAFNDIEKFLRQLCKSS